MRYLSVAALAAFLLSMNAQCVFAASRETKAQEAVARFAKAFVERDAATVYRSLYSSTANNKDLLPSEVSKRIDELAAGFRGGDAHKTFSMMQSEIKINSTGSEILIPFPKGSRIEVPEVRVTKERVAEQTVFTGVVLLKVIYPAGSEPVKIEKVDIEYTPPKRTGGFQLTPIKPIPYFGHTVLTANHPFISSPGRFKNYPVIFPDGVWKAKSFQMKVKVVLVPTLSKHWLIDDSARAWTSRGGATPWSLNDFEWVRAAAMPGKMNETQTPPQGNRSLTMKELMARDGASGPEPADFTEARKEMKLLLGALMTNQMALHARWRKYAVASPQGPGAWPSHSDVESGFYWLGFAPAGKTLAAYCVTASPVDLAAIHAPEAALALCKENSYFESSELVNGVVGRNQEVDITAIAVYRGENSSLILVRDDESNEPGEVIISDTISEKKAAQSQEAVSKGHLKAEDVAADPGWQLVWARFTDAFEQNRPEDLLALATVPFTCGEERESFTTLIALKKNLWGSSNSCLHANPLQPLGEGGDGSLNHNNLSVINDTGRIKTKIRMGEGVDCSTSVWAEFEYANKAYPLRHLAVTYFCYE